MKCPHSVYVEIARSPHSDLVCEKCGKVILSEVRNSFFGTWYLLLRRIRKIRDRESFHDDGVY